MGFYLFNFLFLSNSRGEEREERGTHSVQDECDASEDIDHHPIQSSGNNATEPKVHFSVSSPLLSLKGVGISSSR